MEASRVYDLRDFFRGIWASDLPGLRRSLNCPDLELEQDLHVFRADAKSQGQLCRKFWDGLGSRGVCSEDIGRRNVSDGAWD